MELLLVTYETYSCLLEVVTRWPNALRIPPLCLNANAMPAKSPVLNQMSNLHI